MYFLIAYRVIFDSVFFVFKKEISEEHILNISGKLFPCICITILFLRFLSLQHYLNQMLKE